MNRHEDNKCNKDLKKSEKQIKTNLCERDTIEKQYWVPMTFGSSGSNALKKGVFLS